MMHLQSATLNPARSYTVLLLSFENSTVHNALLHSLLAQLLSLEVCPGRGQDLEPVTLPQEPYTSSGQDLLKPKMQLLNMNNDPQSGLFLPSAWPPLRTFSPNDWH
eukprot:Gb_28335 [translate_table: standard]